MPTAKMCQLMDGRCIPSVYGLDFDYHKANHFININVLQPYEQETIQESRDLDLPTQKEMLAM